MEEKRIKAVKLDTMNGEVTLWSLCGESSLPVLKAGFEAIGLRKYTPEGQTQNAAMKAALTKYFGRASGNGYEVDTVPDTTDTFAVTKVTSEKKNGVYVPVHDCLYIVKPPLSGRWFPFIDPNTGDVVEPNDLVYRGTPSLTRGDAIRQEYWRQMDVVPRSKLASCLKKIAVDHLGGVTVRQKGGGVYWLSEDKLPIWEKVAIVLGAAELTENSENRIFGLSTCITERTVEALCAALTAQVETEMNASDERIRSGKLGKKALTTVSKEADDLRQKVRDYSYLLGTALDTLESRIETTDAAAAVAAMACL